MVCSQWSCYYSDYNINCITDIHIYVEWYKIEKIIVYLVILKYFQMYFQKYLYD